MKNKMIITLFILIVCVVFAEENKANDTKIITNMNRVVTLEEKADNIVEFDLKEDEIAASIIDGELLRILSKKGEYFLLNARNEIIQRYQTGLKGINHNLMLSKNGSLYLSTKDKVIVLYTDGRKRWTYPLKNASFAQSHDGSVYMLSEDGHILKTDINGHIILETQITGTFNTGPGLGIQNIFYAFSDEGLFYMIDKNGIIIGTTDITTVPSIAPIVDFNGDVYIAAKDCRLLKFDSIGTPAREKTTMGIISTQPILDLNNNIIYGTDAGLLFCVNKNNGETIWQFHTDGGTPQGLILSQNDNLYFHTSKKAYCITTDAILAWKSQSVGHTLINAIILRGKSEILITAKQAVLSVKDKTEGVSKSAWPCENATQKKNQSLFVPTLQLLSVKPYNPTPLNGETDTQTTMLFLWRSDVMDQRYDFYIGTKFPLRKRGFDLSDNTITLEKLQPNTQYYWYVESKDDVGNQTFDIWTFSTK
jgi:outer membrane protein assembly factor BamB